MLVERLGVRRLRLLMGTSMGCMHIFVWAETHPDFARAMMPMACLPTEIAGHNRMWRQLADRGDPQRSGLAGRQLHRRQPVHGPAHRGQPAPDRRHGPALAAARLSDPRRRRRLSSSSGSTRDIADARRQRPDLPARGLADLRSAAEPRADPRADDLGQQRRRFHQPARLRHRRGRPPAACRAPATS